MIVILKQNVEQQKIDELTKHIEAKGLTVNPVIGTEKSILGLVGDTTQIDSSIIEASEIVESVMHVQEPFKKANRMFHPDPTIIDVNGVKIGGKKIAMIAEIGRAHV